MRYENWWAHEASVRSLNSFKQMVIDNRSNRLSNEDSCPCGLLSLGAVARIHSNCWVDVGSSSTTSNCTSGGRADDIAILVNSLVNSLCGDRSSVSSTSNSHSDCGLGIVLREGDGRDGRVVRDSADRDDFCDGSARWECGGATSILSDSRNGGHVDSGCGSGSDVLSCGASGDSGSCGDCGIANSDGCSNDLTSSIARVVLDLHSRVETIHRSGITDITVVRASSTLRESCSNTLGRQRAEVNAVGEGLRKTVLNSLALAQNLGFKIKGSTDQEL